MADLAQTAVASNLVWREGGVDGKRFSSRRVTLTLTGQGTLTNKIPASVFGMNKILKSSSAIKSDNSVIVPTSPSADYKNLVLGGGASNVPADYTGTFIVTVSGYPL